MQTEIQPVAKTVYELLISAIRTANYGSAALFNAMQELYRLIEAGKITEDDASALHEILMEQHRGASALPLFIAASNLKIELPEDLRAEDAEDDVEGADHG